VNSLQRRVGVGAFAQQRNPGNHIVVIDELSILVPDRPRELAQPDLRTLRHHGDISHADGSAVLGRDHRVLDVLYVPDQAHFLNIDLLQAGFDKAAAGVGVVVGELLLHLADAQSIEMSLSGSTRT
jgi:hypothetical protein